MRYRNGKVMSRYEERIANLEDEVEVLKRKLALYEPSTTQLLAAARAEFEHRAVRR